MEKVAQHRPLFPLNTRESGSRRVRVHHPVDIVPLPGLETGIPDEARHKLRIALKNLRYAAQFFGGLFDQDKKKRRSISSGYLDCRSCSALTTIW